MKRIKTVISPIEYSFAFDKEVNRYIAQGWELQKRAVINTRGEITEAFAVPVVQSLYAELIKEYPPPFEEVTQ